MAWWKEAVFYQIYPRSFADANGDGVGDLEGIRRHLPYLHDLGVDALWISPFFPSPMRDFGYDVADYRGVDPLFGTVEDFEALQADAHRLGLRIILDLVANHSSDQHPWFQAARADKASPFHGYYLWKPLDGPVPNNWKSLFELRSAWYPNEATGERYLATFTRFQPEFDWRNPALREEIYAAMDWWYAKGVDGFRLDVATAYFKDAEFRSNPFSWRLVPDLFQRHLYDRNRPEVHGVFREMRRRADAAGHRVLIGETHGQDPEEGTRWAAASHGEAGEGLHMAFNFDFLHQPWRAEAFRASAERWYAALPEGAWPNFTLSNHDQPRAAFRFRSRNPTVTEARAKVAAALLLCLRGTPFIYYGEELALGCEAIPRARLQDPLGKATWPLAFIGRDPERTPMPWTAAEDGGFGSPHPWLPLNRDHVSRNVELQWADPESVLSWYRALLSLRREVAWLRVESLAFLDSPRGLLAFRRGPRGLVLLNFTGRPRSFELGREARVLLGTAPSGIRRVRGEVLAPGKLPVGPLEVLILEVAASGEAAPPVPAAPA